MSDGIPIKEFVRLLNQAERAVKKKDLAQIASINAALEKIGYSVVIQEGKAYLKQAYYGPG